MTNPNPAPAPTPKPPRAAAGFIDQGLEDDLTLAGNCSREAAKPDIAAKLLVREWTAANQQTLDDSLARCADFKKRIKEARTGKLTRTTEETATRIALLTALDPVLKGARRTHPDGSPQRAAYGIGKNVINDSTKDLLDLVAYAAGQLAPGPEGTPPKDKLKGLLPAEITVLSQLASQYENANWAQGDAQQQAAALLIQLQQEIATVLNPARRDLQGAADQAFTHREKTNAPERQAFDLLPDKPLND